MLGELKSGCKVFFYYHSGKLPGFKILNLAALLPDGWIFRSNFIILDPQQPEISWNDLFEKDPDQAIGQLFRTYYPMVCQAALRIIPNESTAEDLTQEVFFELWKRKHALNINTSIQAYLRRAVVNKALNYLRDNRLIPVEEELMINSPGLRTNTEDTALETGELSDLIQRSIDRLPERCRLVFTLSRHEELSYQEIAHQMGISVKTVENQMTKALKALREDLKGYLY